MKLVVVAFALVMSVSYVACQQGDWVESFRAPTGKKVQTTTQLYGTPTALSDDGTVAAVGCEITSGVWETRIYKDDQSSGWAIQKTIPNSGFSIAMSGDGNKMALGNIFTGGQRGKVQVMKFDAESSDWVQEGSDITSTASQAMTGYSVSMNGEGTKIIIGYKQHPGGGNLRGKIEIYELVDGDWKSTFEQNGDEDMLRLGHAVSMDKDGTHAIASGGTDSTGIVYAFQVMDDGKWQRSAVSHTGTAGAGFGNSLSMSADGTLRAVSAWKDVVDMSRGQNGRVHFHSDSQLDIRPEIRYSYPNGMFGASVSMSVDGSIVAVGTNSFLGGVYVYIWDEAGQAWNVLKNIPISTVSAPGRSIALSASGSRLLYVERASRQMVVVDYIPLR